MRNPDGWVPSLKESIAAIAVAFALVYFVLKVSEWMVFLR